MSHDISQPAADRSTPPHASVLHGNEAVHTSPASAAAPKCASQPIARLCDALDAAFDQFADTVDPSQHAAFALAIRTALATAAADPALLAPAQREGSTDSYRRHLLAADPHGRYAIAALVWMPGQASPVHAHQTWCGYVVLDGTLSETVYDWNEAQQLATETRSHPRASGAVSFVRAGRRGIHRLGNASDAPAVSLHIYGVEGSQIATHVNDLLGVVDRAPALAEPAVA
ncbi:MULTISPECIES: cysteine dioxygenase family protein [Paraburkholderia]|uniref:Cysteine dioxygenase type I n=1 Tax=Paraburkholderia phenazinium TaxID=60549 RepID=A0A1N6KK59_9BURK|nr:cysteine dioxygenase family protein [Paraburkholderia phenazinium]SIO56948.1 Cysteine dioxygenase type I [Paraburkholderia phenazinium]